MFTSDIDIIRIGQGVADRSLPKAEWTHAAHVACAVWLLEREGLDGAQRRMPGLIRAYNEATGVANTDHAGYHHTITMASLRAVLGKGRGDNLHGRANAALAAGLGRSDWLLAHYTPARLFSVDARRHWVEPDLAPLP